MRQRKLNSLVAAATLVLSACNSGSSGSTVSEATTTVKTVSSSNKLSTGNSLQAGPAPLVKNGFLNWILESNKGAFGIAFAAFPATWAAGVLQNLIFGVQEDVSIKYMKEISEKLDTILTNLELSMNISAITLDTISEFYKAYTGNALTDSFTLVQTSINDVQAKYSEFTIAKVFGGDSSSVTDLSSLYAYAGQHCDDVAIIDAIDVTSSTTGTDSQYDVDTMFTTFTTTYSAESTTLGEASAYKKVATAKTNYKNAMVSTFPKSMDFMTYINRYNYTVKYYGMNLVASYQKLYNMQLAQLAYHYACNASIEFSNLGNISGSGESGFEQSVTELDSKYSAQFTNLNNNVNTYFSSISNTELYTMINTQMFSSSKPLLNATTFNNNAADAGVCTVSKFAFNQTHTAAASSNGYIDMNAICVKSKTGSESETKYESATIMLEIPYHSADGKTLDRYGQYNIKYDNTASDATKYFTTTVATGDLTSDDVNNIAFVESSLYADGVYWDYKESMNIIAPTFVITDSDNTSSGTGYWQGFKVSPETDKLQIYTNKFTYSDPVTNYENYIDVSYSNSLPSYNNDPWGIVQRFFYELSDSGLYSLAMTQMPHYAIGYEYWTLGSYNGKTFIMKIVTQGIYDDRASSGVANSSYAQAIGIFCLRNSCTRTDDGTGDNDNQTILTWADGTQIKIDSGDDDDMTETRTDYKLYKTYITGTVQYTPSLAARASKVCSNISFSDGVFHAECTREDAIIAEKLQLNYDNLCARASTVDYMISHNKAQLYCTTKK